MAKHYRRRLTRGKGFCTLLKEMVADEHSAYSKDYPKLIDASKKAGLQDYVVAGFDNIVKEIMEQETEHHRAMRTAYNSICMFQGAIRSKMRPIEHKPWIDPRSPAYGMTERQYRNWQRGTRKLHRQRLTDDIGLT